jgi:hypothetical protein
MGPKSARGGRLRRDGGASWLTTSNVEILKKGPEAWNKWRSENPNDGQLIHRTANLGGANARAAILRVANLVGADLNGANLVGANLVGA